MLNFLVRSTLGSWGSIVLDFYLANGFWINSLILLLVLVNVLGRQAYARILIALVSQLTEKSLDIKKGKNAGAMQKILDKGDISWSTLVKISWFPLLVVPGKFLPITKTVDHLQQVFSADNLVKITNPTGKTKP